MDLSLLLLATPVMPPIGPAPGDPIGEVPRPAPWGAVCGALMDGVPPGAPPRAPGAATPAALATAWLARTTSKSWPVIGSLYFLRRNRCSTSTSRLGGWVFAN